MKTKCYALRLILTRNVIRGEATWGVGRGRGVPCKWRSLYFKHVTPLLGDKRVILWKITRHVTNIAVIAEDVIKQ